MKSMFRIYVSIFLSIILSVSVQANEIKSAGCVIKTQYGIVWVQDGFTRKLSLPGGMKKSGENPEQTALRETYEETGLRGVIVQSLGQFGSFKLFECRVSSVPVIGKIIGQKLGTQPMWHLNIQNAPHNGTEILGAYLSDIVDNTKIFRYKKTVSFLKKINTTTTSPIYIQPIKISSLYQWDMALIHKFQSYKNEVLDTVFLIFNALGTDKVFFVLLPFLFLLRNRLGDIQHIVFITVLSVLINGLLKVGFAMPRPLFVDPTVQHIKTAYGFGFPSGHTQISTTFWMSMVICFARHWTWWMVFILMSVMTGLARTYFGVHFFVDIVGAWVLSIGIVYGGIKMGQPSIKHWSALLLFSLPVMLYTESLNVIAISCLAFGIVIVQLYMRNVKISEYSPTQRFMFGTLGVILVFTVSIMLTIVKGTLGSSGLIIILSALSYFLIGIILQTLPYGLKKLFAK